MLVCTQFFLYTINTYICNEDVRKQDIVRIEAEQENKMYLQLNRVSIQYVHNFKVYFVKNNAFFLTMIIVKMCTYSRPVQKYLKKSPQIYKSLEVLSSVLCSIYVLPMDHIRAQLVQLFCISVWMSLHRSVLQLIK